MIASRISGALVCGVATLAIGCGSATPPPEEKPPAAEPLPEPKPDPRYQALPTPGPAPRWAPPAATKTTLKNGLSVWSMGGSSTPLISIQLMLPTGSCSDPEGKAGLTLLTADTLDEGAGKYSAIELNDKLGELATDYQASAGVDYVLLSMDSLAETLPESLTLLADIVQRPKLTQEEFERRKQHHLANALTAQDDPESVGATAVGRVLFGHGYAGAPATGTTSSLSSITWQDVKSQAKRISVPQGAHLTIAGMVDHEKALSAVEAAFGSWKGKVTPSPLALAQSAPAKKAFVIDFPGAAQSALSVVTQAPGDGGPNYFAEEVMNEKLGSSFTSRINMNLREDKGYTYGAYSTFRRYRKAGYFGIFSNVKSETTGASLKEIFAELSALCRARPFTEAERNESVEGLLLGYPMQFDQVSSMGVRLVTLPVHDRPADFWQSWPTEIQAVTAERANQAAAPYCDPARYSPVISGDLTKWVGPALGALGYEVVELDREGNPRATPPPEKK